MVEQLTSEKQRQLLEIDNYKTEMKAREGQLQVVDGMVSKLSKENSEFKTHISVGYA